MTERERTLTDLLTCGAGNDKCADCKSTEVKWVSTNLGAFLCINCAGHHRKLGTHISKVQSLTLDDSVLRIKDELKKKGNNKVNDQFEARIPSYWVRPRVAIAKGNQMDRETKTWGLIREKYIVDKYSRRHFEQGKLIVNDTACDRMPQAPFDAICKWPIVFMGKTRWVNIWLIIINSKIQIYQGENSLGAPSHVFDVKHIELRIVNEPDYSFEIIDCIATPGAVEAPKRIVITCPDVETLIKIFHKVRKARMFYSEFAVGKVAEFKIDVSSVAIDPMTLRQAESFGWAYQIKGGFRSMGSVVKLKKNRRFWCLLGTILYKFKDDIRHAEQSVAPTGGIELKQAHIYLDITRKNTIIIHTDMVRFALLPEPESLQKMLQLLPQRVQSFQNSKFIDFVDEIPVEVQSKDGHLHLPPAGSSRHLRTSSSGEGKSEEDRGPGYETEDRVIDFSRKETKVSSATPLGPEDEQKISGVPEDEKEHNIVVPPAPWRASESGPPLQPRMFNHMPVPPPPFNEASQGPGVSPQPPQESQLDFTPLTSNKVVASREKGGSRKMSRTRSKKKLPPPLPLKLKYGLS